MSRPRSLAEALPAFRRILRLFGPHLRRQRPLVAGSVAAVLAEVALRLLEPWPLKVVFDHLVATRRPPGWLERLQDWAAADLLALSVLAVVVFAGLRAMAAYSSTVGFALIGNRVLTDVRNDLYRHLQRLSLSFHARAGSGDLVVRLIGDVGLLKDVMVTALLPLLASTLVLAGMAAVMAWLQWRLALLALAVVPLFWLATVRLGRHIHQVARQQRLREGALAARAAESLAGVNTVKALGLEGLFGSVFVRESNRSLKEGVRAKRLEASLERTADVLTALATALVLGYGVVLVRAQVLSPGELLVFLSYLKSAFRPLRDFARYTGRLAKATAAGERVVDVLERAPEVAERPGAVPAPPLRGAVRFEGVTCGYEPGRSVLDSLDLAVEAGQRVAVVGASGAGKSTLLGLLLRLHDPWSGRVLVDGRDARDYTLASLRAQVSVVLQDALLFGDTVRNNIAYAAPEARDDEVVAAARLANADEFIRALPDGYRTVLGERGATLSAGQRQRIAIARAALRRSAIVILDEPTTGLDGENERAVVEALERLTAGRTTFLVSHDLSLAARADVVVYLESGRVAEQGPPGELLGTDSRFAGVWGLQAAKVALAPRRPHAIGR